jgi:hypothetical protein
VFFAKWWDENKSKIFPEKIFFADLERYGITQEKFQEYIAKKSLCTRQKFMLAPLC